MAIVDEFVAQANTLSIGERAAIAHQLILSLNAEDQVSEAEAEAAWKAEVDERLDRYYRGETKLLALEEFKERLAR